MTANKYLDLVWVHCDLVLMIDEVGGNQSEPEMNQVCTDGSHL